MRIKYPAKCLYCSNWIIPPYGFLHRSKGKWYAHCLKCHDEKESNKVKKDVIKRRKENEQ
jgi:pyruvate-formate lyase-activating enzyme